MTTVDPMTKIGIMLAVRTLAKRDGAKTPQDALEWGLSRGILAVRRDVPLERGHDDLVLTPHGQRVVADFWFERERRRAHEGKPSILMPRGLQA